MLSPFPGMDPYLEHPSLWPDVHNSLIAAIRDDLAPLVAPDYYVGLERRAYLVKPDDMVFVERPDVAVAPQEERQPMKTLPLAGMGMMEVLVPLTDEVSENFLEVRDVKTGSLVTVLELLSPANKLQQQGREDYERKRDYIFHSRTNLVEIDLLRAGDPMPLRGKRVVSDYRILVSRASQRPRAELYPFNLRQAIPQFSLPLLLGDEEPLVEVGKIFHALYTRARFDLRLDYSQPPVPPVSDADAKWVAELIS